MASDPESDHPDRPAIAPQTRNERVSAGQTADAEPLERLARLLATSPHNLVSRNEREHVLERHIRESDDLAAAVTPTGRWMDLGTGGGLPGLVLALRHPDVSWLLVDATAKKVAAVQEFAEDLGLRNVRTQAGRAETLAHEAALRGAFDGVVARAVAPLATLAELARGFLRDGGRLVALKGPAYTEELAGAERALDLLRLRVESTQRLPTVARESWVVTMRAEGTPPAGYPRRDGLPKSDPLR